MSCSQHLEYGRLEDIGHNKKLLAEHLRFQWDYYSELAHQRNQIHDELKEILIQSSISSFKFTHWQRAVKYKYGFHPLSTAGSIKFIGGRFNMGEDINPAIATFPALYVAIDKDTALQEMLGQDETHFLSSQELALTNPESTTLVSVSGELEKVFDLRNAKQLDSFTAMTKKFKLSRALNSSAIVPYCLYRSSSAIFLPSSINS